MEYDSKGPVLKPLLLIGGQSSGMDSRKELHPFPDSKLMCEHALQTLHSAIPSASTIYISLHDERQKEDIRLRIDDPGSLFTSAAPPGHDHDHDHDHDHHEPDVPNFEVILDREGHDIGPAAGLLAAHSLFPDAKWLVLGCDYPLLPPPALQQLILEYKDPVTCFVNEEGVVEPLIGIWGPEALEMLMGRVEMERSGLSGLVKEVGGKLVKPLREEWITRANTREESEAAMEVVGLRGGK